MKNTNKANLQQSNLNLLIEKHTNIRKLEEDIRQIHKQFISNNIPLYEKGQLFIMNKIDNNLKFEIVIINTAAFNQKMYLQSSSNLNSMDSAIQEFGTPDNNSVYYEKIQNMILANNGLMYMYEIRECGKNNKAKKIGFRSHVLTEAEITEYISDNILVSI